jgi:hypothetical protein
MFTNRLTEFLDSDPAVLPVAANAAPTSFVLMPVAVAPAPWVQQVYEAAYAHARAVVEPPRRRLPDLASWN